MKDKVLQTIIENIDRIPSNNIGLFEGKTGVCLSLYYAYLENGQEYIEKAADNLLDEIVLNMSRTNDLSFKNGLTGIGWAINKLHMESCILGDIDDILYNIDASLYKNLTRTDSQSTDSISNQLGFLIYITDRLSNPYHNTTTVLHLLDVCMLRLIINNLSLTVPMNLSNINHDVAPLLSWEHTVLLFYIKKAFNLEECNDQIEQITKLWEEQLCTSFPLFHTNRLSFACVLQSLNSILKRQSINRHTKCILASIDEHSISNEINPYSHSIITGWGYATWVLNTTIKCFPHYINKHPILKQMKSSILRKGIMELSFSIKKDRIQNISLANGLSGILLLFNSKNNIL